jgi:hypothetical protein
VLVWKAVLALSLQVAVAVVLDLTEQEEQEEQEAVAVVPLREPHQLRERQTLAVVVAVQDCNRTTQQLPVAKVVLES